MNKIVSGTQIQIFDKLAIENYGIPSIVLMENAGRAVAHETLNILKGKRNASVSVVCGTGNNGGDGLVAARHLENAGIETHIFLIGKSVALKNDAAVNYKIFKKLKHPIQETPIFNSILLKHITKSDVVIDAMFGVGVNRMLGEPYKSYIEGINQKSRFTISIDVPSGLDATTGEIYGSCIKAHTTVTFTFLKRGLIKGQGSKQSGKVIVADIGIPLKLKNKI